VTILRIGSTERYSNNWAKAFNEKPAKKKTAAKSAAKKKSAKKNAAGRKSK